MRISSPPVFILHPYPENPSPSIENLPEITQENPNPVPQIPQWPNIPFGD